MALPAPQISDAAAVIGVRWPAMNPNAIAATTEIPIATSNATTALIRPRALNISLESGMRRLSVQRKIGSNLRCDPTSPLRFKSPVACRGYFEFPALAVPHCDFGTRLQ